MDKRYTDKAWGQKIVAAARTCLGAPFRLQGREPKTGLDCIGLVLFAGRAIGFSCTADAHYCLTEKPERLDDALLASALMPLAFADVAAGDVLRFTAGGTPLHLGIATGAGVIHADIRFRRVVEHDLDETWSLRLVGAYRFPLVSRTPAL